MRPSEVVLSAYFAYAAVLSWLLPLKWQAAGTAIPANVAILAAIGFLAYAWGLRHDVGLRALRDWLPFPLLLLAYREMGWFAQPHLMYGLERRWVAWDRMLLYGLGGKAAVEIAGPIFPAVLEICYSLVYAMGPAAAAAIYLSRRPERMERLMFPFVLATLLAYAQFPFWPSEPPRTVFAGQDLPVFHTLFRSFNLWMLGGYGIHTSVFPSAHVAGGFSAAFGVRRALPEHPRLGRLFLVMAGLIAAATVYGRYHYLADALAGFTVSLAALGITHVIERWTTPRQAELRIQAAPR